MQNLGYVNGWRKTPDIVKKCNHELKKIDLTGRCHTEHRCEICGYFYRVDSSD